MTSRRLANEVLPAVPGAVVACVMALALVNPAAVLASAPRWQLSSTSAPTDLPTSGEGQIAVAATDVGDAPVNGVTSPVTVTDRLPVGVTATAILGFPLTYVGYLTHFGEMQCAIFAKTFVTCTSVGLEALPPFETLEIRIAVKVEGAMSGQENEATITGGGAANASIRQPLTMGASTPFGISEYELKPENEDGSLDTQAGSHPFQLTGTLAFNQTLEANAGFEKVGKLPTAPALVKDLRLKLPAGLIGNPTPFPQCTDLEFETLGSANINLCPANTAVGVSSVTLKEPRSQGFATVAVPVFNLVPTQGEPARFGFEALGVPVTLDTSVRIGGDYGVVVSVNNISEAATIQSSRVTFWGVPGDPRHDQSRGWSCLDWFAGGGCTAPEEQQPPPLLTLPTSCTGQPLETSVEIDSWSQRGSFASRPSSEPMEILDGCNRLGFDPSISVAPAGQAASTPTGLTVGVHVPQTTILTANGLAESYLKDTTVTLPVGVQVNPSDADGLLACSLGQIALDGASEPTCPEASKVATAEIRTPLLPNPLVGEVYLAAQDANPFGSLIALYLVAKDPVSGVLVKLAGEVALSETGQITTTFKNTPQLPFEDLTVHLFGGERAPLATPPHCGTYTTSASFAPWSGNEPAHPSSSFEITTGPNGSPCPGSALPFAPSLTAGMTSVEAGAFGSLATTISREDGDENIQAVYLHFPAGLSGVLSGLKLCGEEQANAGTCGPESEIGETTVSVGLGGDPVNVKGKVYITEKYEGAPLGLSIVSPAVAGPFNLGMVVVRGKLELDTHTAELSFTSDESGPYAIPQIIDGIPLQIKHINATINRPGFTFNPTSCSPKAITGSVSSVEGARAPVTAPFRVTDCAALTFAPKFSVSTSAHASKAAGASLSVKVSYPSAAQGTQANIARVKVDLPVQLPSQLKTLQKACLAAVFEKNPASCPPESMVGRAKVITPLLPVPLSGPAYFVSHGGEAFPSLTMVLKGYGLTIDLVGSTFIKKGITSSTFKVVPDVPFNTFELTLPQGRYPALGANLPAKAKGSFCGQNLKMPTAFVAQNGLEVRQDTTVSVTGCRKAKESKKQEQTRKHKDAR